MFVLTRALTASRLRPSGPLTVMLAALLVGYIAVRSPSVAAADAPGIVISQVHPGGSGNGTYMPSTGLS